jgi:cytochrome c
MSTRNVVFGLTLAVTFAAGTAAAESPGLGRTISEADIAAWDIAVMPDGSNLPPGSGTPAQGAPLYDQKCAMCHGVEGRSPRPGYSPMVGVQKWPTITTPKTITYYEHATTIFDITRRAMPFQMPRTLTNDEVYAITAYLLLINKLIGPNDVMNKETLPKVKMPNQGKFIIRFPDRI